MLKITVPAAEFWDEIHEAGFAVGAFLSLSFKMGKQME